MTIETILASLEMVYRSGRHWKARCPAHVDRNPSLSIRTADDGRILLYCFAGCSFNAVCGALGIDPKTLSPTRFAELNTQSKRRITPKPVCWKRTAFEFQLHGLDLRLRAESVLNSSHGIETSRWSDDELEIAMTAVHRAYCDLQRAAMLEDVASGLRLRKLNEEKHNHGPRRPAA